MQVISKVEDKNMLEVIDNIFMQVQSLINKKESGTNMNILPIIFFKKVLGLAFSIWDIIVWNGWSWPEYQFL